VIGVLHVSVTGPRCLPVDIMQYGTAGRFFDPLCLGSSPGPARKRRSSDHLSRVGKGSSCNGDKGTQFLGGRLRVDGDQN